MIASETALLLAVAAAFDARTIGDADVNAWHAALYDLEFTAAREAVIAHYRRNDERITPAQIRHLTNPYAANKHVPPPPDNVAANPHEWRKRVSAAGLEAPLLADQRRDLVLRYPDIAAKLTAPPLKLADPRQWSGFIPAGDHEGPNGARIPNHSPLRAQLVAVFNEACERADAQQSPAGAPQTADTRPDAEPDPF